MGSAEGHFTLNDSFFLLSPIVLLFYTGDGFLLNVICQTLVLSFVCPRLHNGTGDYENWWHSPGNNINLGRSPEVLACVVTASLRQRGVMAAESRGVAERGEDGGGQMDEVITRISEHEGGAMQCCHHRANSWRLKPPSTAG